MYARRTAEKSRFIQFGLATFLDRATKIFQSVYSKNSLKKDKFFHFSNFQNHRGNKIV